MLGDLSRGVFLNWILSDLSSNVLEEGTVAVKGGSSLEIIRNDKDLECISYNVIPGTSWYFPKNGSDVFDLNLKDYSCIAVLEGFPFNKESTELIFKELIDQNLCVPIIYVVMDLPRHFSSTDIQESKQNGGVMSACPYKVRFPVFKIHCKEEIYEVLHYENTFSSSIIEIIKNKLSVLTERIKDLEFDYSLLLLDFENEQGCLDIRTTDKICSYKTYVTYSQKTNVSNVWIAYCETALENMLCLDDSNSMINAIFNLYEDILTHDCGFEFMDLQTDKKTIISKVRDKFREQYRHRLKYCNNQLRIKSRAEYDCAIANSTGDYFGINAEFSRFNRDFICNTVFDILKSSLEIKIKKVGELIK